MLLLCEASEFERDMRTILLPGLLEHQQAIQEDMIEKWKIVLQEVQIYSNTTDRKWQETQVGGSYTLPYNEKSSKKIKSDHLLSDCSFLMETDPSVCLWVQYYYIKIRKS